MTMRKWIIFTSAILLACATVAWADGGDSKAGVTLYASKCKTCHGADGAGNSGMAKALKVEFKHLGSPELQKMKDDEWKATITKGKGKMKPVAGLTDTDVANIIAYCRTLKK